MAIKQVLSYYVSNNILLLLANDSHADTRLGKLIYVIFHKFCFLNLLISSESIF